MFFQHLKKRQVILRLLIHKESWTSNSVNLSILMFENWLSLEKRRQESKGEWLKGAIFL